MNGSTGPGTTGLLMVNTGNGKGKTTAALGLVLRAVGHGQRVCIVQFIKARQTGETMALRALGALVDLKTMGRGFTTRSTDRQKHCDAAIEAWDRAREAMGSGRYDLVVLDEITYPIKYGYLEEREVVQTLVARNPALHVLVTGRQVPPSLVDAADLVTEMRAVKHPLKRGVKAQRGIEY